MNKDQLHRENLEVFHFVKPPPVGPHQSFLHPMVNEVVLLRHFLKCRGLVPTDASEVLCVGGVLVVVSTS